MTPRFRYARAALGLLLLLPFSPTGAQARPRAQGRGYWHHFAAGFATSILVHEGGHVATSYLVGARPSFGFNRLRPTIYSGIDDAVDPHKQLLFSSAGLVAQSALDELILDVPHKTSSPFERGVLAGGIATQLFYVTLGRSGKVSDIDFIARLSTLNKTQLTLIYGGIATLHIVRIHHNGRYANFFLRPAARGTTNVGFEVK